MNPIDAIDILAIWLIAGLVVARCCGLNRLEDDEPDHPHAGGDEAWK